MCVGQVDDVTQRHGVWHGGMRDRRIHAPPLTHEPKADLPSPDAEAPPTPAAARTGGSMALPPGTAATASSRPCGCE